MLQINHLSIYHTKDLTPLIENLSFTLRSGERMALIGEEGNGKSTLLRLIAGEETGYAASQGSIVMTDAAGYLPQQLPEGDKDKSAYEYFCESPFFFDQTPSQLGALSSRLRLAPDTFYSEQLMRSFSGGERVKLQLARILMGHPGVLLLDEPSNDLDLYTVRWLSDFLVSCDLPVIFVSHDEALLRRAATSVLLIERLRRRQLPRATLHRMDYDTFVTTRADLFEKQEQIARKEREEFKAKMDRYNQIRQKVEHQQNAISRGDPHGGRLLKKKMHAVMSLGHRFEREKENMTDMPEAEEAIFARLSCAPQDPDDLLDPEKTPVEMLSVTGDKEESVHNCISLGSMKFTAEEMHHPCRGLSGGQKAKLMFLMMAASGANVLLLDEPTRNLSPLSGPVIRELFTQYPGCIIAVSHDEVFAREVFTRHVELQETGLTQFDNF